MQKEMSEKLRMPFFVFASLRPGRGGDGALRGSEEPEVFGSEADANSRAVDLVRDGWAWVDVFQRLGEPDDKGCYPVGKHKRLKCYRNGKEQDPR